MLNDILLAVLKHTFHWSAVVTALAQALSSYADDQREKENEVGFRFYNDLAVAILKVRNDFKARESLIQNK